MNLIRKINNYFWVDEFEESDPNAVEYVKMYGGLVSVILWIIGLTLYVGN